VLLLLSELSPGGMQVTREIVNCPICQSKNHELTPTGKFRTHTRGKRAIIRTGEGWQDNVCLSGGMTPAEARLAIPVLVKP
jgi:hypothetical protein